MLKTGVILENMTFCERPEIPVSNSVYSAGWLRMTAKHAHCLIVNVILIFVVFMADVNIIYEEKHVNDRTCLSFTWISIHRLMLCKVVQKNSFL